MPSPFFLMGKRCVDGMFDFLYIESLCKLVRVPKKALFL